jgi:putative tryptophan/tyrosine transport system substrate-binding protein
MGHGKSKSPVEHVAQARHVASCGPNWADLFRHAAEQVDKVLRGTKPADTPSSSPTKFDLLINATTAKALGIDLPTSLIARADEVIE